MALTTSEVAAVTVAGGPRIPTRREDSLPDGLRMVAIEARLRPGRVGGTTDRLRFTPLDSQGKRIAERLTNLRLAVFGLTTHVRPEPARPTADTCHIVQTKPVGGLSGTALTVLTQVRPQHDLLSGALMPCASQTYNAAGLNGSPLMATILIDAAHPGRRPVSLPAMRSLQGHPGVFQAPSTKGEMLGRRTPGSWLVVTGGQDVQERVALLEDLVGGD